MKKAFLIVLLFCTLQPVVKAQEQDEEVQTPVSKLDKIYVGLKTGLNFPNMKYSDPALREYRSSLYPTGLLFGFFSEIGLNEANTFSIRPEMTFISRGQKINDADVFYKFKAKYTDFFLPVVYTYRGLEKVQPFVAAGPVIGFARGGKIELDDYKTKVTKAAVKSTDFGIYLGAGAKYPIAIKEIPVVLGAELGYYIGLTDTYSSKEQSNKANALNTKFYDIDGKRRHRGVQFAVSAAVPLSVFEKIKLAKKKEREEPAVVVAEEEVPAPVVEERKPCYTIEEMKELIRNKQDIYGRKICAIKQVVFEFGKSTLTKNDQRYLDEIVDLMNQNSRIRIKVNGHTDNVGSEQFNMNLSRERAIAVCNYLASKGIAPGRLSYAYYGATRPIATNDTDEGRATNRRVEFEIINQ